MATELITANLQLPPEHSNHSCYSFLVATEPITANLHLPPEHSNYVNDRRTLWILRQSENCRNLLAPHRYQIWPNCRIVGVMEDECSRELVAHKNNPPSECAGCCSYRLSAHQDSTATQQHCDTSDQVQRHWWWPVMVTSDLWQWPVKATSDQWAHWAASQVPGVTSRSGKVSNFLLLWWEKQNLRDKNQLFDRIGLHSQIILKPPKHFLREYFSSNSA